MAVKSTKGGKAAPKSAKKGKRRFFDGGISTAMQGLYPQFDSIASPGSGGAGTPVRRSPVATGGDSGLPAARGRGSVATTQSERPMKDIGRGSTAKYLEGASSAARSGTTLADVARSARGALGRVMGPVGAALEFGNQPSVMDLNRAGSDALSRQIDRINAKRSQSAPLAQAAPASKDTTVSPPLAKGPAVTPAPKKAAPKRQSSSSSADDSFMADLRASAAKMRDATADMSDKTGRMKEKTAAFAGSFKKGGSIKKPKAVAKASVKSAPTTKRGDGIIRKGFTKGVMR